MANSVVLRSAIAVTIFGCTGWPSAIPREMVNGPASGFYEPSSTIQEIMDSIVDPASDRIWGAFATKSDASGIHVTEPTTEKDWQELRRQAVALIESANLLAVPGRGVANGEVTVETGDRLPVDAIRQRLDTKRAQFLGFAQALRGISKSMRTAIDKKDVEGMVALGSSLDDACEACHVVFWYPDERLDAQTPK